MLYDKRWDKTTKADPYSLESFIAWAEKQPRRKSYWLFDSKTCLAAQWLQATGAPQFDLRGGDLERLFGCRGGWVFCMMPFTVGAALRRARECAAQASA